MIQDVNVYDLKKLRVDKKPRPIQIELLEFAKQSVLSNNKYIIIDAPTGVGKSTFAVMFMDWFKNKYDISATFDVLTNSKILQEQYTQEFDFMNSLWGKGSYHCEQYNCSCDTGMEWAKIQNKKCESCPYATAKYKFENGDVALTNYHLFLTYKLYMKQAWKRSARVLIIDESHTLESVFADFITTTISRPLLKRNGFTDEEADKAMKVFGNEAEHLDLSTFVEIVNHDFLPIVKSVMNRLAKEAEETKNMQSVNYVQSLGNNLLKWEQLKQEYELIPDNWILEAEWQTKKDKVTGKVKEKWIEFIAQPVWAHQYLQEKIWDYYDHVIFMSGTILDKNIFCEMNGLDKDQTTYISVDSPFPVENRPIYFFNKIGKMSYATKDIVWQKQKIVLNKILKKHKKDNGLIHTANYELQKWVSEQCDSSINFLAHDSINRAEIIQEHYNSERPTVLVSPSLTTGIDLKGDYGRFQVIIKVPYPNLKSKKIKKRMETNKNWYALTTVREIIQAYGRCVRSSEDYANTYILDGCFNDVLRFSGHWIPKWIKDAIHYID
jgi:ATP-dependent DNA helicase DinG